MRDDRNQMVESTCPSPVSRPPSGPRHTVHISSVRPSASPFGAQRNPLLPPPARKTDLPFSSQDRYSSPEKIAVPPHTVEEEKEEDTAAQAGPSRPRLHSTPPGPINMSDEEDDFDGIEDALPTQADPLDHNRKVEPCNAAGVASLDDLFADDEAEGAPFISGLSGGTNQAGPSNRPAIHSGRQPLADLDSSPPLFPPLASSTRRPTHVHSDTPPSPLPKTPHIDDEDDQIDWSPSPVTQRTRTRRESPPHVPSSKAKSKGKARATDDRAMDIDDTYEYDDMPFPDDFDFDSLEEPSASNDSAPPHADAGRAFRPSAPIPTSKPPPPQAWSPPSRESRIVSALDELNDPNRLLLIPDLLPAEQDFYRNHWRRGADKGSSKRGVSDDEFSDAEFTGPQPPAIKKMPYKRGAGAFKRGFRGRGRGRGRARGGKR